MKTNIGLTLIAIAGIFALSNCTRAPKVIQANSNTNSPAGNSLFADETLTPVIPDDTSPSFADGVHTVTILEKLPTTRYVYLRVSEGENEYWIATAKQEFVIGGTYFYRDGLMKTNFESKEYGRTFDIIYLVANIVESSHSNQIANPDPNPVANQSKPAAAVDGIVKISDIVSNPAKYAGKTVRISGRCVKVNPNIMGRNWVHLEDGSRDDFDFVVTCQASVAAGQTVTLSGKVAINKDFGSGYKYDIILEEGDVF